MGTDCDENAAAPVAAKNNSRMTETTVTLYSRPVIICLLRRPLLPSLQHRRRPMLLLTLPLREKRLLLFLHLLPGGSFVDPTTTRIPDASTQYFFFLLVLSDVFVYHFVCGAFFTFLYFGPFTPLFFFYLFLFSCYSCRGDYESGGGQWKIHDLPQFCLRVLLRILDIVPQVFYEALVKRPSRRIQTMHRGQ